MKKGLRIGILAVFILFLLVFAYTFIPKDIDQVVEGVQLRLDGTGGHELVTLRIKGKLHRPLFFPNRFSGSFFVSGYDFLYGRQLQDVRFAYLSRGIYEGELTYDIFHNSSFEAARTFAKIRADSGLSQMVIMLFEPIDGEGYSRFRNNEGLVIVAPGGDYDTAFLEAKRIVGIYDEEE